jgi:hypothetical protein
MVYSTLYTAIYSSRYQQVAISSNQYISVAALLLNEVSSGCGGTGPLQLNFESMAFDPLPPSSTPYL